MSSSGSDNWMSHKENRTRITSPSESMLASISEIISSVVGIDVEKENFMEIGCYIYRASAAIKELQTTENTPTNTLQSLSKSIDLAKGLVLKFHKDTYTVLNPEAVSIIELLKDVIRQIGEDLSLIPSSTFEDQEYAETAVRSLSKEMKSVHFKITQNKKSGQKELESHVLPSEKVLKESERIETDLYSINVEDSMENPQLSDIPHVHQIGFLGSTNSPSKISHGKRRSGSLTVLPQVAEYMEPMYDTFFCPLTEKIMDDPVTIETGVTYERKAIIEWYEKFENPKDIVCPKTRRRLVNGALSNNVALKATIDEWKERNEAARIKVARAALSLAITENMVFEALNDLQDICKTKHYNRIHVRNIGMVPLLVKFLEYKNRDVRCATLELLCLLVQDDDEGKEMAAMAIDMSIIIKMLSSNHPTIRHASLLLLLELSRSQSLCEKIGSVTGGILMLITVKCKRSLDAFASEKADEILRNLERSPENIKCMAENGLLEPLLNHLIGGSEEMKMEMASYLGEIVLGRDGGTQVAERASPPLIKMVQSGSSLSRKAAFKALKQISLYHPNVIALVEAGIVQMMVDELFTRTIYNEPMNSKKEASAILANVLESGVELETLQVNTHGLTMASDYVVHNTIYMLKNSAPDEINFNLIRILLCLTKSPNSIATIVSVVKETEASYNLIELIDNANEEIGVASIKLLITLSPGMGHTLVDRLCKTKGQPESLLQSPTETSRITEKHAVSANFLAKLPHQNLTLNQALLNKNAVPTILQSISQIERSGTRTSKYASAYLEGLVGILVRFTVTLYDYDILYVVRTYNFTSNFTKLLMETSSDEVQRLSAIGLENLSSQSVNLSKTPPIKKPKYRKLLLLSKCICTSSSKDNKVPLCPVHRGACSAQQTFCLLDAKAVERLLACLDHENVSVVEASLSAICTLLDDKVDVEKSVSMLSGVNAIQNLLNAVREHKEESLWQKTFWVIERFLMKGGDKSASDISQDRLLPAMLVSAFHHGDVCTREMAEKILRHLNKMPNFATDLSM